MKKVIKFISFSICCALISGLCFVPNAFVKTNASDDWDRIITFESEEEVIQNFDFHFASQQNERRSDKFGYSWEISDGALKRTGNIDTASDTVNIAILTYRGNVYSDFKLSVDFKAGTKTPYWPAVCIRQQIPGKYYTTEGGGTGIFMQQNGKITFWGPVTGGIIEKDIPAVSSYFSAVWHNLEITAVGTLVTVKLDGVKVNEVSVLSTDYVKGYISLQSVNNDCMFDNFKIKDLSSTTEKKNEENKYAGSHEGTPLDDLVK